VTWPPVCSLNASSIAISVEELRTAACALKKNTAPGPDGITNEVLSYIVRCKPDALLGVYNNCLTEGQFPATRERYRIVLLRKGDKPLDSPSSYRPLCLLDCAGKLIEKILDRRLRKHLEDGGWLDCKQFGFRKGRSTTDAVHELCKIVDSSGKAVVGILYLDVKNAFNSAPWDAILDAVDEMGRSAVLSKCS